MVMSIFVDGKLCGDLLGGVLSSNQLGFVYLVSNNTEIVLEHLGI
jgi:hypothetical protein